MAERFSSILVANRGEIACRVLRTAKSLGYRTVAVFSEADREAPHVKRADASALIGPAPVRESYLDMERILDAARRTGAEAIHPGYGFLSENAAFARACAEAGLVFIGPPADAIELMGNKAAAKRRMLEAGIPCVPGYLGADQGDDALAKAAADIGFPLMVKAAAGGGGRGMRLVREAGKLANALRLARSEAAGAFGSDELILEKAIINPRHVELQVFADRHGNVVHFGERDCSVQRRHQKVVEEAPCPVMTPALRDRMGATAVEAVRSIDYLGAGTVEFLLGEDGEFYFLEMNTRLQVEHPVTEMVTGHDLVALQIAVAQGEPLPLAQADLQLDGHAIEVRLYAEDPAQDFMPASGPVALWRPPAGEGVRVDDGIRSGWTVSPYYDAMVAKLIAWGPTRDVARERLLRALHDTALFGLASNRDYLAAILGHPVFAAGKATTSFIGEHGGDLASSPKQAPLQRAAVAAVIAHRVDAARARAAGVRVAAPLMNWSSDSARVSHYRMASGENLRELSVSAAGSCYRVTGDDGACTVDVLADDGTTLGAIVDGVEHRLAYPAPGGAEVWMVLDGHTELHVNQLASRAGRDEGDGDGRVTAPMHGLLRDVCVAEGEAVTKGQCLLVLEAMKMQHEILAGVNGVVGTVRRAAGEQVAAGELLLEIDNPAAAGGE